MNRTPFSSLFALPILLTAMALPVMAQAADKSAPNIVVIMGDDIGWSNIGVYNQGMMAGRTPNLDQLANEGMRFTDYYAEASCTAGRANFITGELPIRTGMTTVGQAGSPIGIPAEAVTIATTLKAMGYSTGQFGKNHLGDMNEFLPTVHGIDEFFGYLYHLDAMEDPAHPNYPQELLATVGPRNMVHSWATTTDDTTVMPRWGMVGKQKIEDAGTLYPERMKTIDEEIRDKAFSFIDKAKQDNADRVPANQLLFPSDTVENKPVEIRKAWETCRKRAELDDFRFHDLRHTAGSLLAMSGASTREIAEVLGHKTMAMAKRYSHLTQKHLGSVVANMNQRLKVKPQ